MSRVSIMKGNSEESSTSDDEMTKKALKEAMDTQFLRESFFERKPSEHAQEFPNTKRNYVEKYDEFGVSEGFKNFMARKLTDLLDRNIEIIQKVTSSKQSRKRKKIEHEESECGIRLLRSSGTILEMVDRTAATDEYNCGPSRQKYVKEVNCKDNNLRFEEAAIDPQYLLSKAGTNFWINRRKGIVYEYKKLPDGTLIEK
ncbi:uncharacterized protein LOC107042062 [Diachasma alloeum]|uniref:uncharacterized protein LOC107042062 n=1 Tax=Diachasma alloeum TaxID=454923 RepID=UPI0007383B23|nr:uncharacterized protein LOC107042062 [Diachasma alloeum]